MAKNSEDLNLNADVMKFLLPLMLTHACFAKYDLQSELASKKDTIYRHCMEYSRGKSASCKGLIANSSASDFKVRKDGIFAIAKMALCWGGYDGTYHSCRRHYINQDFIFDLLLTVLYYEDTKISYEIYNFIKKYYNPDYTKKYSSKLIDLHMKHPNRFWILKLGLPNELIDGVATKNEDALIYLAKNGNAQAESTLINDFA